MHASESNDIALGAPIDPTIGDVEDDHAIQRLLCDELEAIADRLPARPMSAQIVRLQARIERLADHYARAEAVFAALPPERRPSAEAMHELAQMHATDAMHADDVAAALWDHALGRHARHPEEVGYMLRCLFDGCRRAIALKEALIAAARAKAGPALVSRD